MDIDIEAIKDLVRLMVENELSELDVSDGDNKIRLRRGPGGEVVALTPAAAVQMVPAAALEAAPAPAPPVEELLEITSPMVGTFYTSAGPDSDAFAAVGTSVGPDSVVCIVEAMKVMNEIKAECAGEIVEVCVTDTDPVEFGQVLFRVRGA